MKTLKHFNIFPFLLLLATTLMGQDRTDIVIVGGGAGGTAAAFQAARQGAKVMVLEKTEWLGGMLTSAGVSAIDGNHQMPSGLWGEFRDSLYAHYGGPKGVATGWVSHTLFEPSVGNTILKKMASHEHINIRYGAQLQDLQKTAFGWEVTFTQKGKVHKVMCTIVIDATETGTLLPLVKAPFRLGMDSNQETLEKEALPLANNIVQDLTYVAILEDIGTTQGKKGLVKKPKDYDREAYACACKREGGEMFGAVSDCQQMLNYGKLPNNKYMINWPNCGNDYYVAWPKMSPDEREAALNKAKSFTLGFIYYIQQELGFKNLRLAEEFPTMDHLPMIPYDREARRVKGQVFLTVDHLERPYDFNLYRTGIAVGDYPIDHHHDKNPQAPQIDFINIKVPSYNIPLGALVPENTPNFLVAEKNISVSNIVNGATRLQPVVLGIGQAAGALAALSIEMKLPPHEVPVRAVQQKLLHHKAYLMPFLDVDKNDPAFAPIQRIGASGILKGHGVPYKWANETWFYPDQLVSARELWQGLLPLYPSLESLPPSGKPLTVADMTILLKTLLPDLEASQILDMAKKTPGLEEVDDTSVLSRKEVSILVDALLNPFEKDVDFHGNIITD